MAGCYDCKRPYGNEHGFPDMIIPDYIWEKISPSGDGSGLLCPSCICKRLHDAGIQNCPSAFTSGPIRSVSQELMQCLKITEWLKRQRALELLGPE